MSYIPSASCGERTGYSIARVLSSASVSSAAVRSRPNESQTCQSGFIASTHTLAMNVAKASFNHRPFHQRIVTRSPNHMCAISWATTFAITMLLCLRRGGRIDEEEGFAERDEAEVLHRAGGEVGEADEVELVGGIRDREVLGEELLAEGAALLGERSEGSLAGLVHDAQRHAADVDRVGDLELADDEGHEVRREEHRVGEPHPAAAVADRLVRDLPWCSRAR